MNKDWELGSPQPLPLQAGVNQQGQHGGGEIRSCDTAEEPGTPTGGSLLAGQHSRAQSKTDWDVKTITTVSLEINGNKRQPLLFVVLRGVTGLVQGHTAGRQWA